MSTDATRSESLGTVVLPLLTIPTDILEGVLAILDASSLVRTSASCKVLQALEVQAREKLWRRLTLDKWPVAASYGSIAQMSWRGRYRFFLKRTTQRTPQHKEGEVLTEEQLNERFEFFMELGAFPHHSISGYNGGRPEHPNVSLHLQMDVHGALVPRDVTTTPNIMLEMDKDVHTDVMVRRLSDGAVAVLFQGNGDRHSWDWDGEGPGHISFQGGSQWEPYYERSRDLNSPDGLERMSESAFRGDYAPSMHCSLGVYPAVDEDGEEDLDEPATFAYAHLEVSFFYRGHRYFDIDVPAMSRLLTSKHLMVWEQHD